jgi:phage portal protein BeeE
MANKIIMTDGSRHQEIFRVKGINPYTDETPGVWSPDATDTAKQARSTRLVPSVFAGIGARMQAMADLPFTIYAAKGDKVIDSSDNYKNAIGFLPNPVRFMGLTEASLVAAGRAYWFKGTGARTGNVKKLQYWIPSSVTLDPESAKNAEIKFRRQGVQALYPGEYVLHFWLDDESVELGPPTLWPLESAMIAAEAGGAITAWVRDYMRRGAIKAMLLAVDGAPPPGEVERMETWWNKFMTGVRGMTWKVFNMTNVKPTIVGDGLESLKDLSISKELRYDIHMALGTRHLLEDENYATAQARERQFYTQTIMPDARLIQNGLNEQILEAAGYHLQFEPERLEIFQADEAERATSLSQLFGVFEKALSAPQALTLSMEILGYEVSKDQKAIIAEGLAAKEKEKAEQQKLLEQQQKDAAENQRQPGNKPPPPPNKALIELDRWQNKVTKAGKMVTWHAVDLPADMVKAITDGTMTFEQARERLQGVETKSEAALVLEGIKLALNKEIEQ